MDCFPYYGPLGGVSMTKFAGRWITTYGQMELQQDERGLRGTYWDQGIPCTIDGQLLPDGRFSFRYKDPSGVGQGWFELTSYGQIRGSYCLEGFDQSQDWTGQREWDGVWDTSFGRLRLVQGDETRVNGFYDGFGPARIEGTLEGKRLVFRYIEPKVQGEGWFELAGDALSFVGTWRPHRAPARGDWHGRRRVPH